MDRSKKLYAKALKIYNHGYIYKALDLCEKSISLNIRNLAALNLKGLLLYFQGDLDAAQKIWKVNYRINKDKVAGKYLNDSQKDEFNLERYMRAIKLVKNSKINEALELLKICSQSDYNCINVNNYKTVCYIKKAEYDSARECIDKVLSYDKKNSMARKNIRTLTRYGMIKREYDWKKVGKIAGIFILIAVLLCGGFFLTKKVINKNNAVKFSTNKKVNNSKNSNNTHKKAPVKKQESFPGDALKGYIENKNFDAMYDCVMKWKDNKSLSVNDKSLVSNAEQILSTDEGIEYFYNKGYNYINNKDYSKANDSLLKAYQFGSQSYLYPHIIYMLGLSYSSTKDTENTIKYYVQYDQNFSGGDYEETVLYDLAVIYKDMDKSKAQTYANKLVNNYPSSIYNNSVIQSIINQ